MHFVTNRPVRIAVIGVGNAGGAHARDLSAGSVEGAELAAVCDVNPRALSAFTGIAKFVESEALIRSGLVDAVLIATPHYQHAPIAIDAICAGLHVISEKPLAVHKADAQRMLEAYERRPFASQIFGELFGLRFDARYAGLRSLIQTGELGELRRVQWTLTTPFRPEAYYRRSRWRGTWSGEGGGVLLNQCPHALDLWQWLFGMPERVRAFCRFGRFHEIEVEDDVTAHLEHSTGMSGVFVATTGEAPGIDRLEVVGDSATVVLDQERFELFRNNVAASEYSRTALGGRPSVTRREIVVENRGSSRLAVLDNCVRAMRGEAELEVPAADGISSVELANAMIYSTLREETVSLPLDAAAYDALLKELILESGGAAAHRRPVLTPRSKTR